jgi:hypothetical protein
MTNRFRFKRFQIQTGKIGPTGKNDLPDWTGFSRSNDRRNNRDQTSPRIRTFHSGKDTVCHGMLYLGNYRFKLGYIEGHTLQPDTPFGA